MDDLKVAAEIKAKEINDKIDELIGVVFPQASTDKKQKCKVSVLSLLRLWTGDQNRKERRKIEKLIN